MSVDSATSNRRIRLVASQREQAEPTITQFTLFPLLPIELRCTIWRTILLDGINPIIMLRRVNDAIVPISIPPVVFRINRESRQEAMRAYSDSLAILKDQTMQHRLYLLPERDIIYLNYHFRHWTDFNYDPLTHRRISDDIARVISLFATSLSEIDRDKIHNLAIDQHNQTCTKEIILELGRFQELKTLTIVKRGHTDKFYGGNRVFVDHGPKSMSRMLPATMPGIILEAFEDILRTQPQWKKPRLRFVILRGDVILRPRRDVMPSE
ncbi:hypothetical protein V493_08004 [Pseudogymnoascus sp. VKM F-4281 (FW-2241)]|nr:hypothetical protein V493_08004 [Pseudogymnoascus sp. VKM F-4281 (FW-2241)]